MAHIRRRGRRWHAEVDVRGIAQHASFATKAEAAAWAVDVERRIRAGQGVSVLGKTLEDALLRYVEEESPHKAGERWERNRALHFCRDPIAKLRLDLLTPEVLLAWQRRRLAEVSGGTIRRDRALLSAVLRQAVRVWKWLPASPLADVPLPADNPARNRLVTEDELARLWHVAGPDLRTASARVVAAFAFAIETGMRGGEICALARADVVLDRAYVHVRRSKNGDAREVALSGRARALLEAVLALGLDPVWGMTQSRKDALFRKLRGKAGIAGLHFHDSRHAAITRLAKRLQVLDLARQVGVRDLATLMVYYNESAEDRAKRL